MTFAGPITMGVLEELAADFVKSRLSRLKKTKKQIESEKFSSLSSYADRMSAAIMSALTIFVDENPEYNLTAFASFWKDAKTKELLGKLLFESEPNQKHIYSETLIEIEGKLKEHFTSDVAAQILIERRELDISVFLPRFTTIFKNVLKDHASLGDLFVVQAIKSIIEEPAPICQPQGVSTDDVVDSVEEADLLDTPIFKIGGLCSGMPVNRLENTAFVSTPATDTDEDDYAEAIINGLKDKYKVVTEDSTIEQGYFLCKICALISGTDFSLFYFQMPGNPHTALYLGMALGLRKPVFILAANQADVPQLLRTFDVKVAPTLYEIESCVKSLSFTPSAESTSVFNEKLVVSEYNKDSVFLANEHDGSHDFWYNVVNALVAKQRPIVFLNRPGKRILDLLNDVESTYSIVADSSYPFNEVYFAVRNSRSLVLHINNQYQMDSLVAQGIALIMNIPIYNFSPVNTRPIRPLGGLSTNTFSTFAELKRNLARIF